MFNFLSICILLVGRLLFNLIALSFEYGSHFPVFFLISSNFRLCNRRCECNLETVGSVKVVAMNWMLVSSPQIKYCPPRINPQCDGIWRWGLWKVIMIWWGHEGMALIRHERTCSLCSPREDTSERTVFATQVERTHQTLTLLASWSWIPVSRTVKKIKLVVYVTQLYGICYGSLNRIRQLINLTVLKF